MREARETNIWKLCFSRVHSSFSQAHQKRRLSGSLSVGVDLIQQNFEPMQRQVEPWFQTRVTMGHRSPIVNAYLLWYSHTEYVRER